VSGSPGPASSRGERVRAVVAALVPLLAACGGGSSSTEEGSGQEQPCAWAARADAETLNIAYPDTAATYWAISYDLAPSETLELRGTFPSARYASFNSYGPQGGSIDVLTDSDIRPDAGSTNPFAGGDDDTSGDRRYTVVVSAEETHDDQPNTIGALPNRETAPLPTGLAPSTTAGADPDPDDANRLGRGTRGEPGVVSGTVLYRVYLPDDPDDPTGGTGLPDVTAITSDGDRHTIPTCASPGPSRRAMEIIENHERDTDRPAPAEPVFVRPQTSDANLYPNPDNVYIATIVEHRPGRLVVVQGLAPTFPDASDGRPVGSGEQVRFWSFCTNEFRKPYPVTDCAADRDTALDRAGRYTYVISTPEDRPANATAADGVTWLDWGSTEVNNLLLMRHMLADPAFTAAASDIEPGAVAAPSMGEYAPSGAYCDVGAFEQGGAAACFGADQP